MTHEMTSRTALMGKLRRALLPVIMVAGIGFGGAAQASDAELLAVYDAVNTVDIESAELGAVKGNAAAVRSLAVMVLRDHSAVRQMARDIAEDANITYEAAAGVALVDDSRANLEKIAKLEGAAFDAAYLAHEAKFHEAAIGAVKTVLLTSTELDAFRDHLNAVLPGFQHHLNQTLEVAETLGYELD